MKYNMFEKPYKKENGNLDTRIKNFLIIFFKTLEYRSKSTKINYN